VLGLGARLELVCLLVIGMGRMAVEVDEKRDKGIHVSVGFVPFCFNDVA
jgi:hypothetical protein